MAAPEDFRKQIEDDLARCVLALEELTNGGLQHWTRKGDDGPVIDITDEMIKYFRRTIKLHETILAALGKREIGR
jgi:hypothetical protein